MKKIIKLIILCWFMIAVAIPAYQSLTKSKSEDAILVDELRESDVPVEVDADTVSIKGDLDDDESILIRIVDGKRVVTITTNIK